MSRSPSNSFEFEHLKEAKNYRRAIVQYFAPLLTEDVLEVGGGIGQISKQIYEECQPEHFAIIEPNPAFCLQLRKAVPKGEIWEGLEQSLPPNRKYSTIISVNVLEHIEKDTVELSNWKKRLRLGGSVCLFVPARPELYSRMDSAFGHFRRYRKKELILKLQAAGFEDIRLEYFNFLGYFAWLMNFRIMQRTTMSAASVRFFDRYLFPASRTLDKLGLNIVGQSLLATGKVVK